MRKQSGVRDRESADRKEYSPVHQFTPSPVHSRLRRGFTLLEVLLALGLTAVVLGLVGTAVNSTLRTVESGKRRTEREQLARAVIHRIADDLRAVVRYEPFDASGLNSSSGGMSGSSGSGTSSSGTSTGTSSQTGSNTTGQNSSSTGTSGSTNSNSSSQSSGSQSTSQDQTGQTTTLPVAGIYGYANQMQIDITRIPRLDEYLYANGVTAPLTRGDVRTVTYYVGGLQNNVAATAASAMNSANSMINASSGLVRMEADRMTSLWQMQSGSGSGTMSQNQSAVVLAPEVASIQFSFFDGATWYPQWDSTAMNGIPRAVQISIYLYDDLASSRSSAMGAAMNNPDNFYQMVVHLPAGLPLPAIQPVTDDSSQQNSSTSSSSSTGTSTGTTSGTTQNGGK